MQAAIDGSRNTVQPDRFAFGLFEADLKAEELLKNGRRIKLQGQPFRVLAVLLEHHGEVVTREHLQRRLWDENTTVDFDHSLGIAVNKLREALGDSADNPRFIETLARKGYRFIAPVTDVRPIERPAPIRLTTEQPEAVVSGPEAAVSDSTVDWLKWAVAGLSILLLSVTGLALWFWLRTPPKRPQSRIDTVTRHGEVLANQVDVESFSAMAVEGGHVYFSQLEDGRPVLAQALTANGEIQDLRLPSEIVAPLICAISQDGARLIVRNHLARESEQPIWIVPTLGGQALRFSGSLAHDATWMPDGQHILYATGNALFVAREDGQDQRQLVTLPGRAFWLRWSPDGKRLRFTLLDTESGAPSLWEYDPESHKARPLLEGWSHPSAECCGNWTGDGKAYVFQSQHDGFEFSDIYRMRGVSLDRDPERLTNGPLQYQSPATGAGSNHIFFTGIDYRRKMLIYSAASHRFLPLGNNLGATALVEYSRDGQWVAWLNGSDNTLWRSRADGSERLQLTLPSLSIFSIKWSPNNKSLALMARKTGRPWAIYLVDANGGNLRRAVEESLGQADPNWFSNGTSILFGRVPDVMGGDHQTKAIFTIDLLTHSVEKVPGSDGLFSPRLSPDGHYIVALRSDQSGMMLFDRDTQHWAPLLEGGAADPAWASDSRSVFYQNFLEPGEPIYRLNLRERLPREVAHLSDLRPADAADYRLITIAPGDLPVVNTQSSAVNIYSLDLK